MPSCACGATDLSEVRAVLAAVKTALRRLRRWPAASLDCHYARRSAAWQVGTEKRRYSRTVCATPSGPSGQTPVRRPIPGPGQA